MVKKFVIFSLILIVVIVLGGILFYNFLKEKPTEGLSSTSDEGVEKEVSLPEEETGVISTIIDFIKETVTSSSGGSGGGGGGGSSSGGSSSEGSGETTTTSDLTICQNAQNNDLCEGLDITYGEGYKIACCSEHSLCC